MRDRIYDAAVGLFAEKGFHGASVRDLAHAVDVEPASLYYHFPSKQDLLLAVFDRFLDSIIDMMRAASIGPGTHQERLAEIVRRHVLFHVARSREAFISHSELRSLDPENRKRIIAKRDLYERMLRALLEAGVREHEFAIADVPVTSTAILMMCSGVSDWFTPGGRLTPDAVADCYVDLVSRLVTPGPGTTAPGVNAGPPRVHSTPAGDAPGAARPRGRSEPAPAKGAMRRGVRKRAGGRGKDK